MLNCYLYYWPECQTTLKSKDSDSFLCHNMESYIRVSGRVLKYAPACFEVLRSGYWLLVFNVA